MWIPGSGSTEQEHDGFRFLSREGDLHCLKNCTEEIHRQLKGFFWPNCSQLASGPLSSTLGTAAFIVQRPARESHLWFDTQQVGWLVHGVTVVMVSILHRGSCSPNFVPQTK